MQPKSFWFCEAILYNKSKLPVLRLAGTRSLLDGWSMRNATSYGTPMTTNVLYYNSMYVVEVQGTRFYEPKIHPCIYSYQKHNS